VSHKANTSEVTEQTVVTEEIVETVVTEVISKSEQIRRAVSTGSTTGEAAKLAGVSYQFAYNVMHRLPPDPARNPHTGEISANIRNLLTSGMSTGDVAKATGKSFQQVYQTGRKAGLIVPKQVANVGSNAIGAMFVETDKVEEAA